MKSLHLFKILIIAPVVVLAFSGCGLASNESSALTTNEPTTIQVSHSNDIQTSQKTDETTDNYFPICFEVYNPLVEVIQSVNIIGGCYQGDWYSIFDFELPYHEGYARDITMDLVKGGETYKMYSTEGYITSCVGDLPDWVSDDAGNAQIIVRIEPKIENDYKFIIGISGDWNAMQQITLLRRQLQSLHTKGKAKQRVKMRHRLPLCSRILI